EAAPPVEVKPPRRTAQRAPLPPPEPELDESAAPPVDLDALEAEVATEAGPDGEALLTKRQSDKLHAQLRELGKGDREAGLAKVSALLRREVTSTKTLTIGDASTVIDLLDAELRGEPEPEIDDWPPVTEPGDGA